MAAPQPQPPSTNYLLGGFLRTPGQGHEFGGEGTHLSDEDILIQYVARKMDGCIGDSIINFSDKAGLYLIDPIKLASRVLAEDRRKKIVSIPGHPGRLPPEPFGRWPMIEDRGPGEKPGDYPYLFINVEMVFVHLIWRRWVYIVPGMSLIPENYKITDNWKASFNSPGNKPWTNYGDWTSILKFQFEFNGKVLEGLLKTPKVPHPKMDHNVLLKTITDQIKKMNQGVNSKLLTQIHEKLGPLVKLVGSWNSVEEYVLGNDRNEEAGACGHRQGENLFGQLVLIMFFKYVKNYENVIMMRTFSKIHGLAALRLGWCYSSQYIADSLNKVRGPFNVSMAAQKAGIAAINDIEFVKKSKYYNKEQLEFVKNELLRLNIKFYTSFANFILIDFKNENNCQKINQYLLNNGIIIRDMKAYNLPHCLRMTIGMMEENKEFIRLIESFFQKTDPIIKTV